MSETAPEKRRHSPRNLNTVADVQSRLARMLRRLERGEESPDLVRTYVYGCKVLVEIMRGADHEARLLALEGKPTDETVTSLTQ